ncbi:MAG: hypothetical protein RMI89_03075 [Gloeomargarita sp. SKYBB_i_bin120]|nr:hypothetical protein [Gloeomargarita sp. SKYG98]MCS7291943.1 hypothetical protein [Gloeomargarita sp. SKYB120]MDW8177503.1 hypothetical protein [Gloeomargarita sp. SKYBB_i_bin120]
MAWQFLLQRQDAPRSYCGLGGKQPLVPGVYRLWGRTPVVQPGSVTVEWFWPTRTGRQRVRHQEVRVNRRGMALLLPWTRWEAGQWRLRCWVEKPNRTWESWGDGLSLQITLEPCPPQVLALHWHYRCQFPWHQTLRLQGWVTTGQALSFRLHDPLQRALVMQLQHPLLGGQPGPVPFCFDLAVPRYLFQRVLLGVVEVLGTPLHQEFLLVNPLVTARLTPQLTVEPCGLAELAQQAAQLLTKPSYTLATQT